MVIPTSSADKEDIVLKAGERVMVLKSHKGIYMQLESGKIIAIRTTMKPGQNSSNPTDEAGTSSNTFRNGQPSRFSGNSNDTRHSAGTDTDDDVIMTSITYPDGSNTNQSSSSAGDNTSSTSVQSVPGTSQAYNQGTQQNYGQNQRSTKEKSQFKPNLVGRQQKTAPTYGAESLVQQQQPQQHQQELTPPPPSYASGAKFTNGCPNTYENYKAKCEGASRPRGRPPKPFVYPQRQNVAAPSSGYSQSGQQGNMLCYIN